jgi:hypothetical protein
VGHHHHSRSQALPELQDKIIQPPRADWVEPGRRLVKEQDLGVEPTGFYTTGDRVKTWGGAGLFWGSLWGLLFGAAFFWIPGVKPIAVAGPFVHLLVTAVEGAVELEASAPWAPPWSAWACPRRM